MGNSLNQGVFMGNGVEAANLNTVDTTHRYW